MFRTRRRTRIRGHEAELGRSSAKEAFAAIPNGQLAAHVIGNVNAEGQGRRRESKQKLNKDLAGTPGSMRIKVDVKQARLCDGSDHDAGAWARPSGSRIDSEVQHVAEDA